MEGLQNILLGYQAGTVYKNTDLEADAASKLAIALINGDNAGAAALATGSVTDPDTNEEVPVGSGHPGVGDRRQHAAGLRRRLTRPSPTSAPVRSPRLPARKAGIS